MRSTKIVATLGPASDALIEALMAAGVDVFRINFSHGSPAEHEKRIAEVRRAAKKLGRFVAIMADLQGPKIRIRGFSGKDSVNLKTGAEFRICRHLGESEGDASRWARATRISSMKFNRVTFWCWATA